MLRIRLRGPSGQQTCELGPESTVHDLQTEIRTRFQLQHFIAKYGYPPRELRLQQYDPQDRLQQLDVKLHGEQVIISDADTPIRPSAVQPSSKSQDSAQDTPEVAVPDYQATMVLRIMPDDNSCLFRAFGTAFFGDMDNMIELRSIIAQAIQADPTRYTKAVLDKDPESYCAWIQTDSAWGGAIELSILSQHFDIEICSIDVQTLRVDRFNDGRPQRCILVYSGIHYDAIAISPSDPPHTHALNPPDFDTKVFSAFDPVILEAATRLCHQLRDKHYYTDTANFKVKCNQCGQLFTGQSGASQHAMQTQHYDFGEAS